MSDTKPTGGPAFPQPQFFDNGRPILPDPHANGMTLRDYFAAKAMQAEVSEGIPSNQEFQDAAAKFSYQMADAMLRARETA